MDCDCDLSGSPRSGPRPRVILRHASGPEGGTDEGEGVEGTDGGTNASTRRGLRGFVVACVAMVAAGAVLFVIKDRPPSPKSAHFEHVFPKEYVGTVWFTISTPKSDPRQVSVRWQRLRRTFEHRSGSAVTYVIEKGAGPERSEPLLVEVTPSAAVTFNFGKAPADAVDLSAQPWEALPYNSGVAPPRPANADWPKATAAVDESVSYGGVDPSGIGLRPEPVLTASRVGVVKHGEVYPALCWVRGQVLTNSNLSDPADDNVAYTSDIWWRIETPTTTAFISDVWYSRRGMSDKLNLAECLPMPA